MHCAMSSTCVLLTLLATARARTTVSTKEQHETIEGPGFCIYTAGCKDQPRPHT